MQYGWFKFCNFYCKKKKKKNYNWKFSLEGFIKSLRQNFGSSFCICVQCAYSVFNCTDFHFQMRTCTAFQTLFSERSTCHLKLCLVWVSRRLSVWKITKVGQTWFLCISWPAIILESQEAFSNIYECKGKMILIS